jgi:hypothetical protein
MLAKARRYAFGSAVDYNLVEVIAPPRTGSVVVWNVVQALLTASGHRVRAVEHEHLGRVDGLLNKLGRTIVCTHHHAFISPADPERSQFQNTHYVIIQRDIREILFSLMQFGKLGFDDALSRSRDLSAFSDKLAAFTPPQVLRLEYQNIEHELEQVVGQLSGFLQLSLLAFSQASIAKRFTRDKVAKRITSLQQSWERDLRRSENAPTLSSQDINGISYAFWEQGRRRYHFVEAGTESMRLVDHTTHFQMRHISAHPGSAWREHLTTDQIAVMNDVFGDWLGRHGYPLG